MQSNNKEDQKSYWKIIFSTVVTCALVFGCTDKNNINMKDDTNNMKNELTNKEEQQLVWAVAQERNYVNGERKGVFIGTAWIIKIEKEGPIFVTSYHLVDVDNDRFFPKNSEIKDVSVSLVHISGIIIKIARDDIFPHREKDIAFIFPKIRISNEEVFQVLDGITGNYHVNDLIGKDVYNLGFPLSAQRNEGDKQKNNQYYKRSFSNIIRKQNGKISDCVIEPNIFPKPTKCIHVNYTSEQGFSGGPLLLNENNKVIGIMCSIILQDDGTVSSTSIAVSLEEIYDGLKSIF